MLLGALVGFSLALVALGMVGVAVWRRRAGRGFWVSLTAAGLAVAGVVVSGPIWRVMLSGVDTHGEQLDYGAMGVPLVMMGVEGVAVVVGVLGAVWFWGRG